MVVVVYSGNYTCQNSQSFLHMSIVGVVLVVVVVVVVEVVVVVVNQNQKKPVFQTIRACLITEKMLPKTISV